MKKLILVLLACLCLATANAAPPTTIFVVTTQTVSIPAGGYTVSFMVNWFGDDYPQSSAPGRVELRDAGGNLLGRVTASHYQTTGVSTFASLGYLTDVVSWVNIYAADGSPADGQLEAQWHITGVPAGTYTLRFFEYTTWASPLQATTVWTETAFLDGWPSGSPPTITWSSTPTSAANGEGYYVAAHGNDADGNLAQVNVWKNGQPFAFAGGGNGTDGDSGNWTSDGGPQTVTFTAQAVDADGATSPVITHTVTINAVVNQPPSVTLLAPGAQTITAGTTLMISSRATDLDGNISNHNLDIQRPAGDWNYQGGFATGEPYQGGPVGSGADSTRTASFTFSDVGTYTVRSGAYDGSGWYHSATVAITVTPANRAPTIAWLSAPASASHQQSYTISARGGDAEGNLSQVNVWKNGQPFAFAGGGSGFSGDSGNPTSDNGPQTVTFTAQAVDADGATSPVITHIITINAPVNNPPTVTLLSPGGQTITAGTTLTISSHATDPDGNITGHNLDIQRPAGDWNFQGGFATGEPYQGGPVGSGADSTRSASFTFTDVGTYYVRSAASDGSGWYHSATVAITVAPAPPAQFALVTSGGAGGAVSAGGTYTAGTTVMVTATPDGAHDFAGWSGDAGGTSNPLAVLMDRAKTVQANFSPKSFSLTTNASGGGAVTPGGNYPYGTTVTISAAADATHRFVGWAGDASGSAPSIALTITRPLSVQAVFESKTVQTISFPAIGDQSVGASFPLTVTTTSGLPVTLTVTGPATYSGGVLTLTGPGAVSVQATQPGDGTYLPAAPVTRTFNAAAPAVLRYRATGRTFLQTGRTPESIPYVIQPNP